MILTVFRSRHREGIAEEYKTLASHIASLAEAAPGFIYRKSYVADDGERLTLVAFKDEESQRQWALNSEHMAAKERGRQHFYSEYDVQICEVIRGSNFLLRD